VFTLFAHYTGYRMMGVHTVVDYKELGQILVTFPIIRCKDLPDIVTTMPFPPGATFMLFDAQLLQLVTLRQNAG